MKKWTKETVFEESKKYSSRFEFKKNKSGAFRIAYMNGWLDEMTWLKRPKNYNFKWTRENVFTESHKYNTRGAFKGGCSTAYQVARRNRWLDEMSWLSKKNNK